nr:MAG TPA: hypothetical protein [Bacteriophage sp.]
MLIIPFPFRISAYLRKSSAINSSTSPNVIFFKLCDLM